MSAKTEIAEYLVSTSFGGRKPIAKDKRIARPTTRDEAIRQIEAVYSHQRWKQGEQAANSRQLSLKPKPTGDYTNEELKIILNDFERFGMILYEN